MTFGIDNLEGGCHNQRFDHSTAPSPIDPVLTVQPDHCYIFFL